MSITVNADDFGLSEEMSKAIAENIKCKRVDRTTLMVNMPWAQQAMQLAKEEGFLDRVGIHLNLTSGMPLTDGIKTNRIFCDETGAFNASFAGNLKQRFFFDAKSAEQVREELSAQTERFFELGGRLLHVDSHHHVHTDYSVYKVLKPLVRKYGIESIRFGRNMYRGGNPLMHLYKLIFNNSVGKITGRKVGLFGSADDLAAYFDSAKDREKYATDGEIEVMVHVIPLRDNEGNIIYEDVPMDRVAAIVGRM